MKIRQEIITARSNPLIKRVAALQDKKGREAEKSFVVEGEKLSYEALESKLPITHIFIAESRYSKILPKIKAYNFGNAYDYTEVIKVSDSVFEKISSEKAPQGIISVIKYLDFFDKMDIIYKEEFFLKKDERALILCSVRDPLNLGSVIRSSVAFGVEHIILTSDCADVYNTKAIRSAMGSMFKIRITAISNLEAFIAIARKAERRVLAAELTDNAISLNDAALTDSDIVIIGNEGHGIPREISALCDASIYIPISKNTESLNASCAAAIFMWEQSKNS